MAGPSHMKPADFGGEPNEIVDDNNRYFFKEARLNWTRPRLWRDPEDPPVEQEDRESVYILLHNHHRSTVKDHILYVGLTTNPQRRFINHPTARKIVSMRGETSLSLAPVDFIRGRNRVQNIKKALEEIEHILIWALWQELENKRKITRLPGLDAAKNGAWHIFNNGYRFSGKVPREIVYPWMLIKPGRDRSRKAI